MIRIIVFFVLLFIAVYFIWETYTLIKEGRFKVGRSRTWSIIISFVLIAFMMYSLLIKNPIF